MAELLAGLLEVGHELAAAVDLDGRQRERQGADEIHEEASGVPRGGPRASPAPPWTVTVVFILVLAGHSPH